jgi:H+/Cl- antiporter ClcA
VTQPRRPDPEPLKTDDAVTILTGTVLWVVALVVLLIIQPTQTWWIWTCVVGIGLGLFGLAFVRRRDARLSRHESR